MNLLLGRNICFKAYISGSYFGDIEYFTKRRRLFSARVEEDTTLMVISCDILERIFLANPQSHLDLYRRAIKRYLHYKQSMKKASYYEMITVNNQWWSNGHQSYFNDRQIFERLDRFFSVIAENNQHLHIHSSPQNPHRDVIERFGTKNIVFSPVNKLKKTQKTFITSDTRQLAEQQAADLNLHKVKSIGSQDSQPSESEEAKSKEPNPEAHMVSSYMIDMSNMIAQFNNTLERINDVLSSLAEQKPPSCDKCVSVRRSLESIIFKNQIKKEPPVAEMVKELKELLAKNFDLIFSSAKERKFHLQDPAPNEARANKITKLQPKHRSGLKSVEAQDPPEKVSRRIKLKRREASPDIPASPKASKQQEGSASGVLQFQYNTGTVSNTLWKPMPGELDLLGSDSKHRKFESELRVEELTLRPHSTHSAVDQKSNDLMSSINHHNKLLQAEQPETSRMPEKRIAVASAGRKPPYNLQTSGSEAPQNKNISLEGLLLKQESK